MPWTPITDPTASPYAAGAVQWSSYHGQIWSGNHQFQTYGGLVSDQRQLFFGSDISSGMFQHSFVYRYHGLLGGIVRPVARATFGTRQSFAPLGGPTFAGYDDYWTGFARAEAGVEIVYQGFGVGYTYGYQWTQDMNLMLGNEDIVGPDSPFAPQPGMFDLDQWIQNFYLVIE